MLEKGFVECEIENKVYKFDSEDLLINVKAKDGFVLGKGKTMKVFLEVELTDELILEGLARGLVRHIQETRKSKKLDYMDKINVYLQFEDDIFDKVLNKYLDYVKKETQAIEIEKGNLGDIKSTIIDGNSVKINIEKIVS